jgi:hypothetical protein
VNWLHAGLVLAALVGTSGVALSPTAPAAATRHTGFDCVLAIGDRWISCSRFKHLEARA